MTRTSRRVKKSWPVAALVGMAALGLASAAGCQDRLDPATYGKVVRDLPKVKGADEEYPLPQLADETAKDKAAEEAAGP